MFRVRDSVLHVQAFCMSYSGLSETTDYMYKVNYLSIDVIVVVIFFILKCNYNVLYIQ